MKKLLLQKKLKQQGDKEVKQPIQIEAIGKELFCLAQWNDNQISWQWNNITKFIEISFNQQKQLQHQLVGSFVGSQDAIIKFLEQNKVRSRLFEPKNFLQINDEGIYLLKVEKNQLYIIVWPGHRYYKQPVQTQKLVKIALNMCGRIILIVSTNDDLENYELQESTSSSSQMLSQEHKNENYLLSELKNIKLCGSGVFFASQNVCQQDVKENLGSVLSSLQHIHKSKISVQFSEQFWKPIRQYSSLKETKNPYGQLMVLSALSPKLTLQLHKAMLKDPQSVEMCIQKIQEKLVYNSDTKKNYLEIVNADYNEKTEVTKLMLSQILAQQISIYHIQPFGKYNVQAKTFQILEAFLIENYLFLVCKEKQLTRICENGNRIWRDNNNYDVFGFLSCYKLLVLYSNVEKFFTVLQISKSRNTWKCEKLSNQVNQVLAQHLAKSAEQVLNIQVMNDQEGNVQIFIQTSKEIIKTDFLQRSKLEQIRSPQECNLLAAPKGNICLQVYYEGCNWNINFLSIKPLSLEIVQQIKNITPLNNYSPKNTSFNTYLDDSSGKQYLVAVTHDGSFNLKYAQFEIQSVRTWEATFAAIPQESLQEKQLLLTLESKSVMKFLPQQFKQSCDLWENCNFSKFLVPNRALENILLCYPLYCANQRLPALKAVRETVTSEDLLKGDIVWYCSSDQIWIESEIVAQDYVNQTYAVKIPQGEEITYGESLKRRYERYNFPKRANGEIIAAFAAYSQLISQSLDNFNNQNDLILTELAKTFAEVSQQFRNGYLPYDCMSYLYEPFRKVTFFKNQKDLREMLQMLDCFPTSLNLNNIQPPLKPAIEHIEMILKIFVFYLTRKHSYISSTKLELQEVSQIYQDSLSVVQKIINFFERNSFLNNFEQLVVQCDALIVKSEEIKQLQDRLMVMNQAAQQQEQFKNSAPEKSKKVQQVNKEYDHAESTAQNKLGKCSSSNVHPLESDENKFGNGENQSSSSSVQKFESDEKESCQNIKDIPQQTQKYAQFQQDKNQQFQYEKKHQFQGQLYQQQSEVIEDQEQWCQNHTSWSQIQATQVVIQDSEKQLKATQLQGQYQKDLSKQKLQGDYEEINGVQYFVYNDKKYPCIGTEGFGDVETIYEFRVENGGGQWHRQGSEGWLSLVLFPKWEKIL